MGIMNDRDIQLRTKQLLENIGAEDIDLTTIGFPVDDDLKPILKRETCHGDFSAMIGEKSLGGEALTGIQTGLSLTRDLCQIGGIIRNYDIPAVAGPSKKRVEINQYVNENFSCSLGRSMGSFDGVSLWPLKCE